MARRAELWVLSLATALLALTALVVWGFIRIPGEPWRAFPDPGVRADTGVELRVMLRRDTISSRDRSPVEVLYWIVNGPASSEFNNDPERFFFRVEDRRGRLVQPAYWSHRPTAAWGNVQMMLPGGAMLGQVENLRCVRYAAYGAIPGTRARDCMIMWEFARPGTYRVIVSYRGPDSRLRQPDGVPDSSSLLVLDSIPEAERLRLADTVMLVVR